MSECVKEENFTYILIDTRPAGVIPVFGGYVFFDSWFHEYTDWRSAYKEISQMDRSQRRHTIVYLNKSMALSEVSEDGSHLPEPFYIRLECLGVHRVVIIVESQDSLSSGSRSITTLNERNVVGHLCTDGLAILSSKIEAQSETPHLIDHYQADLNKINQTWQTLLTRQQLFLAQLQTRRAEQASVETS